VAADGAVRDFSVICRSDDDDKGSYTVTRTCLTEYIPEAFEPNTKDPSKGVLRRLHPAAAELRGLNQRLDALLPSAFRAVIAIIAIVFAWQLIGAAWKFIFGGS
jgi:hypothetical protein